MSDGLSREVARLASHMSFEQVSTTLERLGQVSVPRATVWTLVERHGQRLQAQAEREWEHVRIERTDWNAWRYQRQARKGIALDGGMVYVRGEGWKEVKAGVVGDITRRWTPERQEIQLRHGRYCAVLGDVDQFRPVLWGLAVRQQVPSAGDSAVTADGAAWIWRLAADLFPGSVQIVDWYHAAEHVAAAVAARFPSGGAEADAWSDTLKGCLYHGHIEALTQHLEAAGLAADSAYFHAHKRRMQYQEFWEQGYPIGSGAIESGIKRYKQRLCGPGMRWSRPGAVRMLTIRSAVLSEDLDRLWEAA